MSHQDIIDNYQILKDTYKTKYENLSAQHRNLSLLRLLVATAVIGLCYHYFTMHAPLWEIGLAIVLTIGFVIMMKMHQRIGKQRIFMKALQNINEDELAYLTGQKIPFH